MARTLSCQSHLLPVFPQVGKVCPHLCNWLTPASPSDLNFSIIFSVKDLIIIPSTLSIYLLFFPIALMTTWYIYIYIWLINFSIPSHHWTINSTETGPLSKIAFSHLHQCLACGSIFFTCVSQQNIYCKADGVQPSVPRLDVGFCKYWEWLAGAHRCRCWERSQVRIMKYVSINGKLSEGISEETWVATIKVSCHNFVLILNKLSFASKILLI